MKNVGTSSALVEQVRVSEKTPKLACLLEGGVDAVKPSSGNVSVDAEFPFMKIVSADSMIGHNEMSKVQTLAKVFDDAYKSNLSLLVLDDLERLLETSLSAQGFQRHGYKPCWYSLKGNHRKEKTSSLAQRRTKSSWTTWVSPTLSMPPFRSHP